MTGLLTMNDSPADCHRLEQVSGASVKEKSFGDLVGHHSQRHTIGCLYYIRVRTITIEMEGSHRGHCPIDKGLGEDNSWGVLHGANSPARESI